MKRAVLIALIVTAFLAGAAARFPLSAALGLSGLRESGLDWRAAEGSVWSGQIRGLTLDDYPLGDVRASLSPFSLLLLSPRMALNLAGPEADADLRLTLHPGGVRVSGGAARLRLSQLVAIDPRLRARGGSLTAREVEFALRGGRCVSASGTLASDALTYGFGGLWRGPALSGAVTCEDGILTLRLEGVEEGQEISATALLGGDSWRLEALVKSQHPDLARIAPVIGFRQYGEGWRYQWSSAR